MENINFTYEDGNRKPGEVKVYALSTCAFCKKALKFLRENSICFSYVYVDELDPEVKDKLKAWLREKYKEETGFPFLVIDDSTVLIGFNEEKYIRHLVK
ncbi:MAG TPA: glutaredoxin family protein [Spirochaetota bacterium]|nr:glutaredoxin family protein [Spirochaetota bacterium]